MRPVLRAPEPTPAPTPAPGPAARAVPPPALAAAGYDTGPAVLNAYVGESRAEVARRIVALANTPGNRRVVAVHFNDTYLMVARPGNTVTDVLRPFTGAPNAVAPARSNIFAVLQAEAAAERSNVLFRAWTSLTNPQEIGEFVPAYIAYTSQGGNAAVARAAALDTLRGLAAEGRVVYGTQAAWRDAIAAFERRGAAGAARPALAEAESGAPSVLSQWRQHGSRGWADPPDPRQVDWSLRPGHTFDDLGRPLNPNASRGYLNGGRDVSRESGRGLLGRWGECPTSTTILRSRAADGVEHVALIQRPDGSWAFMGGFLNLTGGRWETALAAAVRETVEEVGVRLDPALLRSVYGRPVHVVDPRNGPHAWIADNVYVARVDGLPRLRAADDARGAVWVPVTDPRLNRLYGGHTDHFRRAMAVPEPATPALVAPIGRSAGSASRVSEELLIANSRLGPAARRQAAIEQLALRAGGRSEAQVQEMAEAVFQAHTRYQCSVGACTAAHLRGKIRTMREAGMDDAQIRGAIERGLAGDPPYTLDREVVARLMREIERYPPQTLLNLRPEERAQFLARVIADAGEAQAAASGVIVRDQYFTVGTYLLEAALARIPEALARIRLYVEVGSGSGNLTTILQRMSGSARIVAYEADAPALSALRLTADRSRVDIRQRYFQVSDLRELVRQAGGPENVGLVMNPPYFLIPDLVAEMDRLGIRNAILYGPRRLLDTSFSPRNDWRVLGSLGARDFYPHAPTTVRPGVTLDEFNHVVVCRGTFCPPGGPIVR